MLVIKSTDNIFCTGSEKEKTFYRVRYGIPMAHMHLSDPEHLHLEFDSDEEEDNFLLDHNSIVLEQY